jgi:hypothetical protein
MKYKLQGISTLSIAKFGCLLGWIVALIPNLLCALTAWQLLAALRVWLEGLEQINLSILGFDYVLDLIDILQLQEFLTTLQSVEGRAIPLMIALLIAASVVGGVLVALVLILVGWGYNLLAWLTGGLEVELREIPGPPAPRQ